MNRQLKILTMFFIVSVLMCGSILRLYAQSSQETLKQYISDLQKNPGDTALREKIIKLAQSMDPSPVIPAEAVKFSDRGEYAAKTAKTEEDFADAAKEYKKALLIAPWVADYYFNLGVLQEKANQAKKAANSFSRYLLAAPNAKDAREVQKRIAGLEYASEKKESNQLKEIGRDKRFIAYDDGTVLDTITNLMWAAKDNGDDIDWPSAKIYCENYHAGGYTDWRIPTSDELAGLYDAAIARQVKGFDAHVTKLIDLSMPCVWAAGSSGSEANTIAFSDGKIYSIGQYERLYRALPVRSIKK